MKPLNTIGIILVSVGGLTLIGFGFYHLWIAIFSDISIPKYIQWGIAALFIGLIIILISLIIERVMESRK